MYMHVLVWQTFAASKFAPLLLSNLNAGLITGGLELDIAKETVTIISKV